MQSKDPIGWKNFLLTEKKIRSRTQKSYLNDKNALIDRFIQDIYSTYGKVILTLIVS